MGNNKGRNTYEFDLRTDLLGNFIKEARKEQNLTQEQLGKMIGVKKAQISRLEKNGNNITIDTIQRIFKALNTEIKFSIKK